MNHLLDKKTKRNRFIYGSLFIIFLFVFIYFKSSIFYGLSLVAQTIFRPVLVSGNNLGGKFDGIGSFFNSKKSLFLENESLRKEVNELQGKVSNYNSILDENINLKGILGRGEEKKPMVLGSILSPSNQSPYDTLLIDVGEKQGIALGGLVFAFGNVPIGRVALLYPNTSKVILFSNPGETTEVLVPVSSRVEGDMNEAGENPKNVFMQLVGRGRGNFEMTLLRDFKLPKGTEVVLPGITPHAVAVVETIISDPRDSFQKALLTSLVNINELKFVQIDAKR